MPRKAIRFDDERYDIFILTDAGWEPIIDTHPVDVIEGEVLDTDVAPGRTMIDETMTVEAFRNLPQSRCNKLGGLNSNREVTKRKYDNTNRTSKLQVRED